MTQDDTKDEKATPVLSTGELVSKDLELIVADIYFVPDHPEIVALQLQGPGG